MPNIPISVSLLKSNIYSGESKTVPVAFQVASVDPDLPLDGHVLEVTLSYTNPPFREVRMEKYVAIGKPTVGEDRTWFIYARDALELSGQPSQRAPWSILYQGGRYNPFLVKDDSGVWTPYGAEPNYGDVSVQALSHFFFEWEKGHVVGLSDGTAVFEIASLG